MDASYSLASYSFTITKASLPDGMAEKIKGITERFEEISNARRDLHLREEDGTRLVIGSHIRPPTSSHVDEKAIFGREEEKEKIISLLNPNIGPDFMVLPIVGMGGFGKTTLAQLVYNDSEFLALFNKKCWVSVSEDFDLLRLTKAIVDSVSDSSCESSELSKLQDVLKENIRDLALFLVLDDVWNEKRNLWEFFRVGFFGAKSVRILTTTRNTSSAKIMQTTSPIQLGSLPKGSCWLLFKHFAFGNKEATENANLHEIGRGIVKKCGGLPLAVKALGGILRYEMDEEKWQEILESNISEIDETGEIMPVLRLSYRKLPRHLKTCFLYLSMFPKDKTFKKDMVVRLWMAQGYINGNTRNLKTLEEIGSEYFDELQGRSLIDCVFTKYLLHDLIHDLARSISQEAYQLVFEIDEQCNGAHKVYHLYLLGSFWAPNNNWSIRIVVNAYLTQNFDFAIFSEIACVRALQLRYSFFPNTLGIMKHLRYLLVEHSQMETLPETLCLLYNLQTLDLKTYNLQELPKNINNLINLRYFRLNSCKIQQLHESIFLLGNLHTLLLRYCTNLTELPRGIEQLTRLRILDLPVSLINMPSGIGQLTTLKPLSGHFSVMDHGMNGGLGELKDMNKLSGLLLISGLKNIRDVEYPRNANLASKPNLHELILNFEEYYSTVRCGYKELHLNLVDHSSKNTKNENDIKIQDVVLQSLQPHGNLKELAILNYGVQTFPSWFVNLLLPKLTTLTLHLCVEPNLLPPFGQLPCLRFLEILGRTGVSVVEDEHNTYSLLVEYGSSKQPKEPSYPALEVLSLRNMLNLEWQAHDGDFPCLKKLFIENCPKIENIAVIPLKVREVAFNHCPKLKVLTCPSVIEKLTIHECGFCEIMFGSISDSLIISKCVELISVKWIDMCLNSIRLVTFEYCPKLEVVTLPDGILTLIINECGFREILFQSVLDSLTISNCVELISIKWADGGLKSIREVSFEYCPKLEILTIPVGTCELKIHDCGFRAIMFHSVSMNLLISNCLELISINWMNRGLNSVKKVSFEYCPKLEIITIPIVTLTLIINKCGFREIMFQSVSEYLTISNCRQLTSINWMDEGLNSVRAVAFEYCPKLELINIPVGTWTLIINECGFREIMFQSVSGYLAISNCIELISINWMDKGLNNVEEVSFEYCPKMELVTIPVETLKLNINECGFREITFQAVSEYLTVSNCIDLISVNWMDGGINSIREVSFKYCPKLELQLPGKHVLHSMTQRAEIYDCPGMDLGKRYVYQRNTEIKELNLFGNNEIDLSHASVNSTIPLLEKPFTLFLTKEDFLGVESLTRAPSVGVSYQCIMLHLASLVILEISRCRKVISVTGLDNLSNLKRLSISYCPELCNWNDKALPLSLKFLELNYCDKLSSLPLLSVQNHSSILKVLVILRCGRLAVLEGFHGLMNLKTVELLHCGNISISPDTESLQFRSRITIGDCPLMRDWCQRNSITYYELIESPQDNREAKLESAEQESAKRESSEQRRAGST